MAVERAVSSGRWGRLSCAPARGEPLSVARAYVDALGVRELYVADLDAITEGSREAHAEIVRSIVALGPAVWLDAGVSSTEEARWVLALGVEHVVVGLETLESFEALVGICETLGGERVALSLDLRAGQPVLASRALDDGVRIPATRMAIDADVAGDETAGRIAATAVRAEVGALIVLDLARVGSGAGVDLTLVARVRAAAPRVTLLVGGGVRSAADLARLAELGCDGALVATALHDGTIGAAELIAARRFGTADEGERG